MNREELERYIGCEICRADARVSLLAKNIDTGETLHAHGENDFVSSASTIKVPIMLCVLQQVADGKFSLNEPVVVPKKEILDDTEVFDWEQIPTPCTYPLRELIHWMIVSSDNTATNVLIELVGFDAINATIRSLGLHSTVLLRKMLDFATLRAGLNNLTSAYDQYLLYEALCKETTLTPALCRFALDTLKRQRDMEKIPRYIADDIKIAHKTGGLDPDAGHDVVCHDAGVLFLGPMRLYLGIFITEAPDDALYSKRLIGRLAKAVYDCYKG